MSRKRVKAAGELQYSLFEIRPDRGVVLGVFYVAGKRRRLRLCSLDEAGLDTEGHLPRNTASSRNALYSTLQRLYDQKKNEVLTSTPPSLQIEVTAVGLMDEWLAWADSDKTIARRTVEAYRALQKAYQKAVGDHAPPFQITHVDTFRAKLSESLQPASINMRLRTFKTFLRWATKRGKLEHIPEVSFVKEVKRAPAIPTDTEVKQLRERLERLSTEEKDARRRYYYRQHLRFFMLGVGLGFRREEVLSLQWSAFDFTQGIVTARAYGRFASKDKKDKRRAIPLFLLDFLKKEQALYPKEEKVINGYAHAEALTHAFCDHQKALGWDGRGIKSVHWMRAWYGITLQRQGVSFRTIQTLFGHSSPSVTAIYVHPDASIMDEASRNLVFPE